jgi:glycosyltransferase involved in cell wall biosynthesis
MMDVELIARTTDTYDRIVATSDAIARKLLKLNPLYADVLSNGSTGVPWSADLEHLLAQKSQTPNYLNVSCLLDSVKAPSDVTTVLRLRERVERAGIELRLSVIDIGSHNRSPDDVYVLSPEADAALFTRPLDRGAITRLFETSDVLLVLSADDESSPWLEWAMAQAAVPIALTSANGIVKNGANGFIIDDGDLEGLANTMAALGKDCSRRLDLARRAHRRVAELQLTESHRSKVLTATFAPVFVKLAKGGRLRSWFRDKVLRDRPSAPFALTEEAWSRRLI